MSETVETSLEDPVGDRRNKTDLALAFFFFPFFLAKQQSANMFLNTGNSDLWLHNSFVYTV